VGSRETHAATMGGSSASILHFHLEHDLTFSAYQLFLGGGFDASPGIIPKECTPDTNMVEALIPRSYYSVQCFCCLEARE